MDTKFLKNLASSLELAAELNDALIWYSEFQPYRKSLDISNWSEFEGQGRVAISYQIEKRARTRLFAEHFTDDPTAALLSCIKQLQNRFG